MICRHNKRVATPEDLRDYSRRAACVRAGDCECYTCETVCWDTDCDPQKRGRRRLSGNALETSNEPL